MIAKWRENLDNIFFLGSVLTDLSKAFDGIPPDLLIAKISVYGLRKLLFKRSQTLCSNK